MESHMHLCFVGILREALKIFYKNGKLLASFTLLTCSLLSILYLFNVFSLKPLITEWIVKENLLLFTSPNSPEHANLLAAMHKDIIMLIGFEWIFLLIGSPFSFFFSIATILASTTTHSGKNLSLKDLLSTTTRSLKRPFLASRYTSRFCIGYIFLALLILLPLMMTFQSPLALKALFILLSVSYAAFYAYLAVVWTLVIVVSVLEQSCKIEALGKAAKIVKGMKLQGFLINFVITIPSFILLLALYLMAFEQSTAVQVMIGLLILNSLWLVKLFGLMAYTVFYYLCKKTHGEEVELQGNLEYSLETPLTVPLINQNIP